MGISCAQIHGISITSSQSGTEIWWAISPSVSYADTGVATGPSGATISGLVVGTTYNLKLTKAGYDDWTGSATVVAGSADGSATPIATVSAILTASTGSVHITSTPAGATIYIDSNLQTGTSPQTYSGLSPGTNNHTYELTLSEYYHVTGTFSITSNATTELPVTFPGSLYVTDTVPSGASVYINNSGTSSGTTPLTITNLSDGSHPHKLSKVGYADITGNFSITAGQTTTILAATFAGSVNITSTPTGAEIFLAASPGSPSDQVLTTPQLFASMTAATSGATSLWNYKLTLSGYADVISSFTATAGQTLNLPVVFPASAYITSSPSNAEIHIDGGGLLGHTPSIITGLTPGSHDYRLHLTGYTDSTGSFMATAGQTNNLDLIVMSTEPHITATGKTVTKSKTPCIEGDCSVTISITWTNTGQTSGTFTPTITFSIGGSVVKTVAKGYTRTALPNGGTVTETFVVSDLTAESYSMCPVPN